MCERVKCMQEFLELAKSGRKPFQLRCWRVGSLAASEFELIHECHVFYMQNDIGCLYYSLRESQIPGEKAHVLQTAHTVAHYCYKEGKGKCSRLEVVVCT